MKSKNFNIILRGKVLEKALILEELTSDIIKLILRIVWDETKTLGNQSTSLSFKNKTDLLFDLQDLNKDDYNYLLKIMEVRNQFAHNFDCNLWDDLKRINPKSYEFISKKFPNEDESFSTSFRDMFQYCYNKLIEIEKKYSNGLGLEIEKIITNEVFQNVDTITEMSVEQWKKWCEELSLEEYETSKSEDEFKLDGIKKIFVSNFLKYREKLYKIYRVMDFEQFRENLRRKVDNQHMQEYIKKLDEKYDFVYREEWDELTESDEVLEDDYINNQKRRRFQ
ncbi:MAG: hypothetical protein KA536_02020 [Saprospiraceae bacterium]|nr:hypothetical protein [Saprospiraceae bacterium]